MLKVGNYVRCPIGEDKLNPRKFISGKITSVNNDTEEVSVKFYDIYEKNKFFTEIPTQQTFFKSEVKRVKLRMNALAIYKNEFACKIVEISGNSEGFYKYYIEPIRENRDILLVNEKDLKIQYDDGEFSPIEQIINYELHNPIWYKTRSVVSKSENTIKNSPEGFELLLGSRVYLFPHQMDTIIKGLNEDKCRMMLADEVGLGKTIEACIIFMGLKEKNIKFNCLFIVPESLINQWKTELSYKFWIDTYIWKPGFKIDGLKTLLVAVEDICEFVDGTDISYWDMCIVDETHRLLLNQEYYNTIYKMSKTVENILLLSATPIQQRKTEYLALLKLLNPERYTYMESEEFSDLLIKAKNIKDNIYRLVKDLQYFYEDELWNDYIEDLEDLNIILEDKVLKNIINNININCADKGLEIIKLALAYISNTYEIEKHIVRNRRIELNDSLPKRTQEVIKYSMEDASKNFYELETYNSLLKYLDMYSKKTKDLDIQYIKSMISATLSSPWSLEEMINKRIDLLKSVITGPSIFENELQEIESVKMIMERWKHSTIRELEDMEYFEDYPDEIKGRLLKIIDYLDENYIEEKVVIFSHWTETALNFERYLKKKLGKECVVGFYEGKSIVELEKSVDRFQEDKNCRFLICDKLGGEGRNFQMADIIVHLDLPWSPIELEQRIGRLDRIGREKTKDVLSIIILADGSIEVDLYNLWNESLNIFNESLSGIEIALNDVENQIKKALLFDIKEGLKGSIKELSSEISKMKDEVEKERYYDYAKRLNPIRDKKLNRLVSKFDSDGGKLLRFTMDSWADLVGLKSRKHSVLNSKGENDLIISYLPEDFQINSAKVALFNPPNTQKALKRSKSKRELKGSFSTDIAVNREDLIFFSPGDEVFDSIIDNAKKSYRGRSTAFVIKADIDWKGLVFTWNTEFNKKYLLENNYNETKFNPSDYLILDQITTFHPLFEDSKDVEDIEVKKNLEDWINNISTYNTVHLGKRNNQPKYFKALEGYNSNLAWFKGLFNPDIWERAVKDRYNKSRKIAKRYIKRRNSLNQAIKDYDNIVTSTKAKSMYFYGKSLEIHEDENIIEQKELTIKGLKNLKLELDSVAFIWMVKEDE